ISASALSRSQVLQCRPTPTQARTGRPEPMSCQVIRVSSSINPLFDHDLHLSLTATERKSSGSANKATLLRSNNQSAIRFYQPCNPLYLYAGCNTPPNG